MALEITSPKNPRVKETVALLEKAKARRERGAFAMEGAREIDRALESGYEGLALFVCGALLSPAAERVLRRWKAAAYDVTPAVFEKLAVRDGSDGVVAVLRQKGHALAALEVPAAPLVLAVHGVEKPGNLGALLRTADGAGVDAVVVLDARADLYNPHCVRASLGGLFSRKVAVAESEEFRAWAKDRGVAVVAAALRDDAVDAFAVDYRGGTAVLLGSEAEGLPEEWVRAADRCVKIPMRGICDSLNVSVAGAVLLYEAVRQRVAARG